MLVERDLSLQILGLLSKPHNLLPILVTATLFAIEPGLPPVASFFFFPFFFFLAGPFGSLKSSG